jgi:site-specific DNA-methyltransferase (adenine-specific)
MFEPAPSPLESVEFEAEPAVRARARKSSRTSGPAPELDRLHPGDCLDLLPRIEAGSIDLVFADPPFNIG